MAQVTMELRNVLQMNDFKLFDFNYPIADLTWKEEFEKLFIDYFYFHEIGQETIDRFKHSLKTRLRLIMPRYVELYESKLFDINPLLTTKLVEYGKDESTTQGNQNATNNINIQNNRTLTEYPQTSSVESDIPTQRDMDKGTTTSNNTNVFTDNQLKDYKKVIEGFSGDQNTLLKRYRDNILNINEMLINELKCLFILIY